jgi:hypothetical protein
MTTTILLKQNELTKNTILGGNIDVDRYVPCIKEVQNTLIKPLLGKILYDKICLEFDPETGSLTGLYNELYEDYVKPMVINGSAELYLSVGAYMVSNNGITKMKSDSNETVSKEEVDYLVQSYRKLYNHYERQFLEWIKLNPLPEYNLNACNSFSNRINVGGWSLKRK